MWKTFKAELKHIFANKVRPWEWFIILIIPFLYGFLYMNAYWNPFGHTDKLRIAVVNLDKNASGYSASSENYLHKLQASGQAGIKAGQDIYKINIKDISGPAQNNQWSVAKAEAKVKNNQEDAVIIINQDFKNKQIKVQQAIIQLVTSVVLGQPYNQAFDQFNQDLAKLQHDPLVSFYNSAKNSYLAHEMTNFGAGLNAFNLNTILPTANDILNYIKQISPSTKITVAQVQQFLDLISKTLGKNNIVNTNHTIGENINTYGKGLSPYFICIALWAGSLTMIFLFKNKRHAQGVSTLKHYWGKSLLWVLTSWIQAIILSTAITLQGVTINNFIGHNWELYLLLIFLATIFSLVVQSVAYLFRYGDLGEFAAVTLLILQLISSSGTFPVEVQNRIFGWLHPVIPFTYGINAVREILFEPNLAVLFTNLGWLLIFPTIFVPLSLLVNYRFDIKNRVKEMGQIKYPSFEIELDDY